jgi:hypothetical protein
MPTDGKKARKIVHGDDLLYRFFRDGFDRYPQFFAKVPELLVSVMGIWLPLDAYERWPILLPWVVRDPSCRGNKNKGLPDEWSGPDEHGYLRDDNSLIKALPRALTITGPKGGHVNGSRMGSEFVACHIWRKAEGLNSSNTDPRLNSFIPNLVWLPSQVAKLSDLEGGIIQQTLQAISYKIYRFAPVRPHLQPIAEEAWRKLPKPKISLGEITPDDLNWFQTTPAFFKTRASRLESVITALGLLKQELPIPERVVTHRYAEGLPRVDPENRSHLLEQLTAFLG